MTNMQTEPFGSTPDGQSVDLFTMTNANGLMAKIISYGAALTSMMVPDRLGVFDDVTLGFDTLDEYMHDGEFLGVMPGRFCGRISNSAFTLHGVQYHLPPNEGVHHLHGGPDGFHRKVWDAQDVSTSGGPAVELSYCSPDGEAGYSGQLLTTVQYGLSDDHQLQITYQAVTDKPTVVNLTSHAYWNLAAQQRCWITNYSWKQIIFWRRTMR